MSHFLTCSRLNLVDVLKRCLENLIFLTPKQQDIKYLMLSTDLDMYPTYNRKEREYVELMQILLNLIDIKIHCICRLQACSKYKHLQF